ncbi:type I-E CRISPR-associated protein Cas6/Cse3/CasE [Criibacterium bergeronii]|uniref:Type I-E CRISPR-associated protein Cas6/Cse3/CasE n=1 Tax=Criibacterium bergeronii TaxID=1871336 RepID=A0A552VBY8_9FIRM|nr:type I-E CRISPR-associated protein Cas6/Cse3/CasE [Criibacterium bergeronii]TRW27981.1 type I-E CRISPR-associated protein Cas6/Cse3/CasE [Criibacterium bergeronii]
MYMSRVEIDVENRKKIKDLIHLSAIHNWVETSFPNEFEKNLRTRKLWRIDRLNGKTYLILVSQTKPNLSILEKYGVENTAQTKDYDKFLDKLKQNQKMKFRITLNPVITKSMGKGNRGIAQPQLKIKDQEKFLLDRAEKNGFRIKQGEFLITQRGTEKFEKKGQKSVDLVKAVYEGTLEIINVELFKQTLINGIGKKKAYGFGLMTVIPLE